MAEDYKKLQQEARDAHKRARNGPRVICRDCKQPVGEQGSQPIIKTEKGEYVHRSC
jgi:hypothetical protein